MSCNTMEAEEFGEQHELTCAIGRSRHDDSIRSHRTDIHQETSAVAAWVKRRCDDAALGIGFILGAAVDGEREDTLHREEVIILSNLSDDFLFSTGVAFILAELPIGAGIDMTVGPTERSEQFRLSARDIGGGTDTEVTVGTATQPRGALSAEDEVFPRLPETTPVSVSEKSEWGILIMRGRSHKSGCIRTRHGVLQRGLNLEGAEVFA